MNDEVIRVESVVTKFGEQVVHNGLSFSVSKGTVVSFIGGSGSGKSTLLKELIGLQLPTSGRLFLFGTDVWSAQPEELSAVRRRFGVLFQNGALFSNLTVAQNIAVPLREHGGFSEHFIEDMVDLRLKQTGLSPEVGDKMPSDLSGGMRKRVSLARALALEPEILFLDEPTSGLDPLSARAFDRLVRTLNESLALTVFMVTHDLDSIRGISDRVVVLGEGHILADGTVDAVSRVAHPWIQSYFNAAKS